VFHLGYDTELTERCPDQNALSWLSSLGIASDACVCWFVGTFGRTYNLRTVIEAARTCHQSADAHRVVFVLSGTGPDTDGLAEAARGLPNVVFTGWLDEDRLRAMSARADIGLAAYAEQAPQSLPNKLGEYAAAGMPIVSSLTGEAAALIEERRAGLSFSASDPHTFLAAVRKLAGDRDLRRTLGANARSMFDGCFDGRRIYDDMAEHVLEVATRGRLGSRLLPVAV
jgi:glycosyltransferase involved in cell wall biosynthesis